MSEPKHRVGSDFASRWPDSSALASECVLNLVSVAGLISGAVQTIVRQVGLPSTAAANVLGILRGAGGPLLPSAIADQLVSTKGNVTQLLVTLERRGLVRRLVEPRDRRRIPVEITPEGEVLIDAMQTLQHPADRAFMSALTTTEQGQLLTLLAKLQTATRR